MYGKQFRHNRHLGKALFAACAVLTLTASVTPAILAQVHVQESDVAARVNFTLGQIAEGKKDYVKAFSLYRKAAEAGNPAAMSAVGAMYATGRGVSKNKAEGVKWFRKSADAGNSDGIFNLGVMYMNGRGVSKKEALP